MIAMATAKLGYQHPGFYYQVAAKYTQDRRKLAQKLCEPYQSHPLVQRFLKENQDAILTSLVEPLVLGKFIAPILIMHGPWKTASGGRRMPLSPETSLSSSANDLSGSIGHPLEPQLSASAIDHNVVPSSMQRTEMEELVYPSIAKELQIDHSALVIQLLEKASDFYQGQNSQRMVSSLLSQIAHEYLLMKQYSASKKLYDRIVEGYRKEGWWSILNDLLRLAMECALNLNLLKDYIEYGLEIILPHMSNTFEEKANTQNSIISVVQNPREMVPMEPILIPMKINHPLIGIQIEFRDESIFSESPIELLLSIRSNFPLIVEFSRLRLEFSDPSFDIVLVKEHFISCPLLSSSIDTLSFAPGKEETFRFGLVSKEKMELKCTKLSLDWGIAPKCIEFSWNTNEWPNLPKNRPSVKILAHESKLEVLMQYDPPALIGEFFKIELCLRNLGNDIGKGEILFEVPNGKEDEFQLVTLVGNDCDSLKKPLSSMNFNDIHQNESFSIVFYTQFNALSVHKISIRAAYETRGDCYSCSLEKIFDIPVKSPFIPSFNFFTSQFHPISLSSGLFVVSQPFLMQIDLQAGSDHPFLIMETQLCLNTLSDKGDLVATCLGSTANSSKQHAITKNEEFSFWYSLVSSVSGDEVSLGKIRVQWRRFGSFIRVSKEKE